MEVSTIIIMVLLALFSIGSFLPIFLGSDFDDEEDDFESDDDFDSDSTFDIF